MAKTKALATQEPNTYITTVDEFQQQVDSFAIANPEDLNRGVAFLSELNRTKDRIEAEKDKVMRPALDVVAAERARWKPTETKLVAAITVMRRKISDWQTAQVAKVDKQADKIAERVAAGTLTEKTAIRKMDAIEKPEETVSTESGQVSFRTDKKCEVMDITMLPHEYLLPNEPKIRAAMKAGIQLPGVRYWEEQTPINYR